MKKNRFEKKNLFKRSLVLVMNTLSRKNAKENVLILFLGAMCI